jgi:co-chaperonin GroES (HSP10)
MALWGNKDSKTASGTVTIASNGNVTGSSTSFTTQAKVGDYIRVSGEDYLIKSIASNTAAVVVAANHGATLTARDAGSAYTLSEKPKFVGSAESAGSASGVHGDTTKVFGVDTTEVSAGGDNVTSVAVVAGGTKYKEVPAVSFTGGGGSSAAATATISGGAVSAITVTNVGSSYETVPTVVVGAPFITFNAATALDDTTEVITYTGHLFETGDEVDYSDGGGTAIGGLTDGETYYIVKTGANTFKLAASLEDATAETPVTIDLTDGVGAAHTLTLTSGAATATAAKGSGSSGQQVTHTGWVRKTVGTGGRAGRVQYETLVAGGSITGDQADDIQLPDA